MMAAGIFITGTDTGVGKTYVGAQLCRMMYKHGIPVQPRKPVESGCESDADGQLLPEDAISYFSACEKTVPLQQICPYPFPAAVAPDYAARLAGKNLRLKDLVTACQVKTDEFLLVEGAGGFYSPIASDGLNADLAAELELPVLLVADNRLGTINHALLTADAIQHKGLRLAAVILNPGKTQKHEDKLNNRTSLETRLDCPVYETPEDFWRDDNWMACLGLYADTSAA